MAFKFFNRARFVTSTTGTGTLAIGAAFSDAFLSPEEAGAVDGDTTVFVIEEGEDFEIVVGAIGGSVSTLTRSTVRVSKIAGSAGTTKMTLAGAATVRFIESAEDLNAILAAIDGLGALAGGDDAGDVPFTPTGGLAATDVAGALAELDSEKVPTTRTVNGHALSGDVTVTKGDVSLGNADNTSDANKPVSTAQQTALDLKANLASPAFTGSPAAPTQSAGDNSTKLATTAYADAAAAAIIAASDAMVFKGVIDCSANPNYPAADRGWTYRVSVAGKIGGGSGVNVEAGDILLCLTDGTSSGNQATVGSAWSVVQVNLDGAVTTNSLATDWAAVAHAATGKTTPVDADELALIDSAASNVLKKLTWANLKATLKAYFDTLYAAIGRSIISGNGLTGGGDLSADRTLAVGAGTGIVANADDVAIDPASTTDVLTGTSAAKVVTPDALAALWEKGSNVASAATLSLGEGGFFHVTGTTGITDIDFATAKDGRWAWLVFDGILTITHNATTLQLPGGANITTAAGARGLFVQDATDNVICLDFVKADGTAIVSSSPSAASQAQQETGTDVATFVSPGRQQFHPSALKWWAQVAADGSALTVNYNVSGITDTGTGNLTISIATDFSSANWACFMGNNGQINTSVTNSASRNVFLNTMAAGSIQINTKGGDNSDQDPTKPYNVGGAGDQA